MINSFKNYLKIGKVKKKTADLDEAKSLFRKSQERIEYIKDRQITKVSAKFILEDAYEAIREAAQSLMSIKGYKPYSHEATISFVREFYEPAITEETIQEFDRFRKLRNNSIYRAIQIEIGDAEESLVFASKFIKQIGKLIKDSNQDQK